MNSLKRTIGFILGHPLGGRHPFRALARLAWWQLQCRLFPDRLVAKPFIHHVRIYARKGLTGVTGNIYGGLHEFFDMGFLLHFLREEDLFFDVGANAGTYSLLASGVCGAQSVSLEPVPSTFGILSSNVELNQLAGLITLVNMGAGEGPGNLKFSGDEDTTNHVLAQGEPLSGSVDVPVTALDALLSKGCPALVKIDVEGFETVVLKGMTAILRRPELKAIIIELNGSGIRYGFDEQAIHALLKSKGFMPYHYDPFQRTLVSLDTFGSHNTIYCRDEPFIKARLIAAAAFSIYGERI